MKVAFDIDDTLIIPSVANDTGKDIVNPEILALYRAHQENGDYMILWSGSGTLWCMKWNRDLDLKCDEIRVKQKYEDDDVDICYDDCIVNLAKENIRVKRVRNSISRSHWNKTKHNSYQ